MKKLLACLFVVAAAVGSVPASALTYSSLLEYKGGLNAPAGSFGKVTLTELADGKTVDVVVTLFAPQVEFINTGGPHNPFAFNLTGDYLVTPINTTIGTNPQVFTASAYSATSSYNSTPFGGFTNILGCCNNKNPGHDTDLPPLHFTVSNATGLSVVGTGATYSNTGTVLTLGTGPRFTSNSLGSWFAADVRTTTGQTFNIAATTMTVPGGVPEASTWSMIIIGFGFMGGSIRRRVSKSRATLVGA